jgi:hypothetical protein
MFYVFPAPHIPETQEYGQIDAAYNLAYSHRTAITTNRDSRSAFLSPRLTNRDLNGQFGIYSSSNIWRHSSGKQESAQKPPSETIKKIPIYLVNLNN